MIPTGNARHQAATAIRADRITELRTHLHATIAALRGRLGLLDVLTDTRQAGGLGVITETARDIRDGQTRLDRAAARGQLGRNRVTGQGWMNPAIVYGTGIVPAPVTMPAVSAAADIRHVVTHHVARLSRKALLVALELEQTETEDTAACTWPAPAWRGWVARVHQVRLHADPTDLSTGALLDQLDVLVDAYTSRPGLEHILADLERLYRDADDVIDGPARSSWPDPCPWCARPTLVVHHREPGRAEMYISCDGPHPCRCDDPWCGCHHPPGPGRPPNSYRHEWVNSGRAARPVDGRSPHALTNLIRQRKEDDMAETTARDAIARIHDLHQPLDYYLPADDCVDPDNHQRRHEHVDGTELCLACPTGDAACGHCTDLVGQPVPYPCPTITATQPTDTTTD